MTKIKKIYYTYMRGAALIFGVGILNVAIALGSWTGIFLMMIGFSIALAAYIYIPNPLSGMSRTVRRELVKDYKFSWKFWFAIPFLSAIVFMYFHLSGYSIDKTIHFTAAAFAFNYAAFTMAYCAALIRKQNGL